MVARRALDTPRLAAHLGATQHAEGMAALKYFYSDAGHDLAVTGWYRHSVEPSTVQP